MARQLIEIENADIIFKNFSGAEKKAVKNGAMRVVNDAGNRNFTVNIDPAKSNIYYNGELVTDPDFGLTLADEGFNITVKPGREEGDPAQYRLQVAVSYNGPIQPKLYQINRNNRPIPLTEQTVNDLDGVDIVMAKIVINSGKPYINDNGEKKVKAWCNEGYFTYYRSRFASEYDFDDEVNE